MPELIQALQSLVVVFLAPLYAGVLARAEAITGSRRGPSVLQPYRDLRKLLRKGSAVSDQASWIFRGAPFVAFACYLTVSAIVPVITDDPLPLAFLADLIGGAFVLGLASWIGSMAEPALILVFFTVGAVSAASASWAASAVPGHTTRQQCPHAPGARKPRQHVHDLPSMPRCVQPEGS
jgi:formate hydrogenlyase subunit 4